MWIISGLDSPVGYRFPSISWMKNAHVLRFLHIFAMMSKLSRLSSDAEHVPGFLLAVGSSSVKASYFHSINLGKNYAASGHQFLMLSRNRGPLRAKK